MTIFTDTYVPWEGNKHTVLKHIEERCMKIKKSLRKIEKDTEHLTVRCPVSGDYLEVVGTVDEIEWLDNELRIRQWYRVS